MSDDIPMLSIIKKGSATFPRVIVAKSDEFRNPAYWTGSGWSAEEAEAMVFANANDASWVCHDVLMESVSDLPLPCFRAIFDEALASCAIGKQPTHLCSPAIGESELAEQTRLALSSILTARRGTPRLLLASSPTESASICQPSRLAR